MNITGTKYEKTFAEEIILNYYNDFLLEHGIITEEEHNLMCEKITSRGKL